MTTQIRRLTEGDGVELLDDVPAQRLRLRVRREVVAFLADLADASRADRNAGAVAFNPVLSYAPGTVGAILKAILTGVGSGAPFGDINALVSQLAGLLGPDQLTADLRQRIDLIDANGTGLVDVVDQLVQQYGGTVDAGASAAAAAASQVAALQASVEAALARDQAAGAASSASTQAGLAASSASAAGGSAGAAANSEITAQTAATSASNSAIAANTSRLEAQSSAGQARTSEEAAVGSATSAARSASFAATSQAVASQAALDADASADSSATSAMSAATLATNASDSASLATSQAQLAVNAANAAGGSATAAASSANSAQSSANNAGASAAAANSNRISAETAAANASVSSGSAAGAATSASGSASAAAAHFNNTVAATGPLTASVSQLSTALAGPDGVLAASVFKVTAVRADGRKVYGAIGAIADGSSAAGGSQILLEFDKLLFVPPGAPNDVPVGLFALGVVDGVLTMIVPAARIGDASLGPGKFNVPALSAITANIGELTAGVVRNATDTYRIDVTNGREIVRAGSAMKVSGAPFGSSNQFIEWYGPALATLSQCTESNGTYWLKTNGASYFGGTLSAGVLKNAVRTSDSTVNASVILGPFGTNGGQKSVVVSYDCVYSFSAEDSFVTGPPGSATVVVERSVGSGAWVQVSFLNAPEVYRQGGGSEPGTAVFVSVAIAGSVTFTDNTPSTLGLRFRARLTSRTFPSMGGSNAVGVSIDQTLGIVSTE